MTFVSFNSQRGRQMRREERIHLCAGPTDAVAVHLVFNAIGYVVNEGSLARSMTAARKLVHRVMEEYDAGSSGWYGPHATLTPITEQQACVACNTGEMQERRRALWQTAVCSMDHMTRVQALIELADSYERR